MKRFNTETELARLVVAYLTDLQWDVYQEVQPVAGGPCADIVATQDARVWVIETKLTFGLSVIEQAYGWLGRAHLISVATPYVKNDRMARLVCQQFGIGHLYAGNYYDSGVVTEGLAPRLLRRPAVARLKAALIPERKTYAEAGNSNGNRLTSFGITCAEARRFVENNPGCTIRELVAGIPTHYKSSSSARNSLTTWIGAGKVAGVRLDWGDGKATVWPADV